MSLKISGFQYIHLLSSTVACEIISSKELSPVFSLTHCIPLGENIENPEDDPVRHVSTLKLEEPALFLPIYLVSPQLFVTSEHIMSDKFSTSSFLSFSLSDVGVVTEFRGLECVSR
jgi:hypothetical protein